MERWLVILNCQTYGVANCLAVINPDISVVACDYWEYKNNIDTWRTKINEYDHIILNREIKELQLIDYSLYSNTEIPQLLFGAYHPDLCTATSNGQVVTTVTDAYNSIICLAGYQRGLSVDETKNLFRSQIYEQLGYFDHWTIEKEKTYVDFEGYGFDLKPYFSNWGRYNAFMYSINHPKIRCLFDLALMITQARGKTIRHIPSEYHPYDNLQNGSIFPIYPEIALQYGVEGAYLFKFPSINKLCDLHQFIQSSYSSYDRYEKGSIVPFGRHCPESYNKVCDLLS